MENQVHLFYDVILNNPWKQVKIHHALSDDGEKDFIQDTVAILSCDDFKWTADEIRSPSALEYNNQLYLYFAGHVLEPDINLGIGLEIFHLEQF